MVALQIREVPEAVRDALAAQARGRGQSLQAYLLDLVETEARRARNAELLDRLGGRRGGLRSRPDELADQLQQDRQARQSGR
jgi:hypothetical protein